MNRLDLALATLLLAVVAPFVQSMTAQSAPRYALPSAIVESGAIELDDYEPIIGVDRVEIDGHLYSDKAPGQPFLSVPIIAVAEWLGADPADDFRIDANLGLWSLTLTFCTVPAAVLIVLMRRHASRATNNRSAAIAALCLSFGTMLLPFASSLYAHVFVATLTFGAYHLLSGPSPTSRHVIVAGSLSALASASEYPMLYVAGVLGLYVLIRFGSRRALLFGSPHIVATALVLAYHRAAYDSFSTGYSAKEDRWQLSYGLPSPGHVADILVGDKGFIFTPMVLIALGFLVHGMMRRSPGYAIPAAIVAGFFVLQAGWPNPWGGEGPGPRYLAPALPFLVVPTAVAVTRLRTRWVVLASTVGVVSMGVSCIRGPGCIEGLTGLDTAQTGQKLRTQMTAHATE
ncbi:MAG: hypothetical protein OSA99_16405 [Acidimicrobiales bacterium]|nr:hypothetical protein [Acidimicrobiales bacterium]